MSKHLYISELARTETIFQSITTSFHWFLRRLVSATTCRLATLPYYLLTGPLLCRSVALWSLLCPLTEEYPKVFFEPARCKICLQQAKGEAACRYKNIVSLVAARKDSKLGYYVVVLYAGLEH